MTTSLDISFIKKVKCRKMEILCCSHFYSWSWAECDSISQLWNFYFSLQETVELAGNDSCINAPETKILISKFKLPAKKWMFTGFKRAFRLLKCQSLSLYEKSHGLILCTSIGKLRPKICFCMRWSLNNGELERRPEGEEKPNPVHSTCVNNEINKAELNSAAPVSRS